MRVAVLTEMGPWSASTRYRALQHLPRLERRFDRVDLLAAEDEILRRPGAIGRVRYFARHASNYVGRWRELGRRVGAYDALFVQRGLYPVGPGLITRPVEDFGGRVVLDLDDAVFVPHPQLARKGRSAHWLYGPQQAIRLHARAEAVIVSTQFLAEALPPTPTTPLILPTVPDPRAYAPADHATTPPRVVWAGTNGGLMYLDPLAPALERLRRDGVGELEVISSVPWAGPARFRPWRRSEEDSSFAGYAVGIMPLPDTPYTRGKAGFKLLQYMSAGLPVVASGVGVNRQLVEESGAGYIAESEAEWEEALRRLLADRALRAELGARGREFVERYGDLDAQADRIEAALRGGTPPTAP